jgi:hypothetical protein
VDQIIINITNRCTLRCKECSVYIPYIEHPVDFDADGIIKDTANVMEVIGEFRELTLFGGEPLIHKDILRLLKYCKCSRNFKVLNIITNGTVLPDNELLEELRTENRLLVRISNYGDLSAKRDELVKMLSDNGVKHMVIDYKVWYKNLGICAPVSDERMLKYKFDCCMRANFPCVSNGKLFLCKAAMSLCEIGVFPISENNCLNLVGLRDAEREERSAKIRNYIERMRTDTYIDACKYCSGKVNLSAFNMVPPAIQSEHLLRFDRIVGTD